MITILIGLLILVVVTVALAKTFFRFLPMLLIIFIVYAIVVALT